MKIIHYQIRDTGDFPKITACGFSYISENAELSEEVEEINCKLCIISKRFIIIKDEYLHYKKLLKYANK